MIEFTQEGIVNDKLAISESGSNFGSCLIGNSTVFCLFCVFIFLHDNSELISSIDTLFVFESKNNLSKFLIELFGN